MATTELIERPEDMGSDESRRVARWLAEIDAASKHEKKWRKRAHDVIKQYRDEDAQGRTRAEYNILWSNTETLKPALYSATPRPDIRRRYRDEDIVGREVARVLERGISFQIDTQDFDKEILEVVQDYLLPGRGVARERYVPTMAKGDPPRIDVDMVPVFDEDSEAPTGMTFLVEGEEVEAEGIQQDEIGYFKLGPPEDEVVWEEVRTEYVLWGNFRQSSEPLWRDKRWVSFGTEMTRDELVDAFGAVGERVTLERKEVLPDEEVANPDDTGEFLKTAFVWEIWDRKDKQVHFVTSGLKDEFLLEIEDPLKLRGFFPCPEPLISVQTNDSSIPIPEYAMYQDLAQELSRVTDRIAKLVDALKVRGVYDTQFKLALSELLSGGENELIALDGFSMLAEKGGLDGVISWMPIEQIGKVLVGLYNQRNQIINSIYEITGISDILRGATDPRETATAQKLKGQFGNLRLQPRQRAVQRFVRDLFRIKAEIMAEMFEPETLSEMTATEVTPDMVAVMRDDAMRTYKVDVETDSTIAEDDARDKQDVVELFQAMGEYVGAIGPMVESGAIPMQAAVSVMRWGMRKFKVSRDIEEMLDQSAESQPQEQGAEQPDPAQEAEAQAMQAEQQALQAEMQAKMQESQARLQMDAQAMQAEQARKDAEAQQRMQIEVQEFEREQARKDALNAAKIESIRRQEVAREEEMRTQA